MTEKNGEAGLGNPENKAAYAPILEYRREPDVEQEAPNRLFWDDRTNPLTIR
jgi:hypothetical protein